MAAEPPEVLMGVLPSARMDGGTDYDLILTDRRVVAARVGSAGAAPVVGFLLGGVAGYAIGQGVSSGRDVQRARYSGLPVDQILWSDPRNFQIPLGMIQGVRFNGGINMITMPRLTLWFSGRELTFKFMNSYVAKNKAEVAYVKDVLQKVFPGRAQFQHV